MTIVTIENYKCFKESQPIVIGNNKTGIDLFFGGVGSGKTSLLMHLTRAQELSSHYYYSPTQILTNYSGINTDMFVMFRNVMTTNKSAAFKIKKYIENIFGRQVNNIESLDIWKSLFMNMSLGECNLIYLIILLFGQTGKRKEYLLLDDPALFIGSSVKELRLLKYGISMFKESTGTHIVVTTSNSTFADMFSIDQWSFLYKTESDGTKLLNINVPFVTNRLNSEAIQKPSISSLLINDEFMNSFITKCY